MYQPAGKAVPRERYLGRPVLKRELRYTPSPSQVPADVGGVFAVALGGGVLSVASLVGFITLFGIATRNGVLLVSHYRHLMREEGLPLAEAVVQGSRERLALPSNRCDRHITSRGQDMSSCPQPMSRSAKR